MLSPRDLHRGSSTVQNPLPAASSVFHGPLAHPAAQTPPPSSRPPPSPGTGDPSGSTSRPGAPPAGSSPSRCPPARSESKCAAAPPRTRAPSLLSSPRSGSIWRRSTDGHPPTIRIDRSPPQKGRKPTEGGGGSAEGDLGLRPEVPAGGGEEVPEGASEAAGDAAVRVVGPEVVSGRTGVEGVGAPAAGQRVPDHGSDEPRRGRTRATMDAAPPGAWRLVHAAVGPASSTLAPAGPNQ